MPKAFDNDRAGHEAAERLRALWPTRSITLCLPEGCKDVGQLAEQEDGRAVFERMVRQARDMIDWRPESAGAGHWKLEAG